MVCDRLCSLGARDGCAHRLQAGAFAALTLLAAGRLLMGLFAQIIEG